MHRTNIMAGAGLVLAAPVALWGLMGRQDAEGFKPSELDYYMEPWRATEGWDTALGVAALLVTAGCAFLLSRAGRRGAMDPRHWQVLLPLVAAGLIAAMGLRVLTAGVIGANIGAGLFLMTGPPLIAGLLLWALVQTVRHRLARRTNPAGPAAC
ncbi:hypothetical protein [Streptomyces sp. CAU 1734]|uniref:hypothetical protein n=1 Tax=Streptomyces sp. CAU 1734 TaxID=3140360 RepID=UPI003260E327